MISFDGRALHAGSAAGRAFDLDSRCIDGPDYVSGAYANVCALSDEDAAIPFDQTEVQQVRRDALEWWIPMLGDTLVCVTMLALDESRCGGAITVTREPVDFGPDPFSRLFPGTLVRTDIFSCVAPPAGPVIERYAGVAWPGGSFR